MFEEMPLRYIVSWPAICTFLLDWICFLKILSSRNTKKSIALYLIIGKRERSLKLINYFYMFF